MATVVNNPQPAQTNNGSGFLLGVILLIVFALLFFVYGLPYLTSAIGMAGQGAGTQVNVPDKINVNVQQPQK